MRTFYGRIPLVPGAEYINLPNGDNVARLVSREGLQALEGVTFLYRVNGFDVHYYALTDEQLAVRTARSASEGVSWKTPR